MPNKKTKLRKQEFLKEMDEHHNLSRSFGYDWIMIIPAFIYAFILLIASMVIFYSNELLFEPKIIMSCLCFVGGVLMLTGLYSDVKSIKKTNRIYVSQEKAISSIRENCNIEEIEEYYNREASSQFKKDCLDTILEEEISNLLAINGSCNPSKILKELENEEKLKIKNT